VKVREFLPLIWTSFAVISISLLTHIQHVLVEDAPVQNFANLAFFRFHLTELHLDLKALKEHRDDLGRRAVVKDVAQRTSADNSNCIQFQSEFDPTWLQNHCDDSKVFVHGAYECFASDLINQDLALSLRNQMFAHCKSHCVYNWADPTRQGWFYISRGQCFKEIEDPLHQCFTKWPSDLAKMKTRSQEFCRTKMFRRLLYQQRTKLLSDTANIEKDGFSKRQMNLKGRIEDKESQRLFLKQVDDPSMSTIELHNAIEEINAEFEEWTQKSGSILTNSPRRAVCVFSPITKRVTWYADEIRRLLFNSWKTVIRLGKHMEKETGEKFVPLDLIIFRPYAIHRSLPDECKVSTKAEILSNRQDDSDSRCYILPLDGLERTIWLGYNGYINSIRFLHVKEYWELFFNYNQILKTDLDTFLTPAFVKWNPEELQVGRGAYIHFKTSKEKLKQIGLGKGVQHYGLHNVGATWYGPPLQQMIASLISTQLAMHILYVDFEREEKSQGVWPGWYRGVTSMYSSELGINHATKGEVSQLGNVLDCKSEVPGSIKNCAHIHCWHTDASLMFSKFAFKDGHYTKKKYPLEEVEKLDLHDIRYFALATSMGYLDLIFDRTKDLVSEDLVANFH